MKNIISHVSRTTGVLLALAGLALSIIPPTAGVASIRQPVKSPASIKTETANPKVQKAYGQLPLKFEANRGQTDDQVKFLARGQGYTLFLTPTEATLRLRGAAKERERAQSAVVRMKFVGANPRPQIEGSDELPGVSNYFSGRDRRKWMHNIPSYARVNYRNLYPGIDLTYYEGQGELEYDYVVAAGSDPKQIKVSFAGAEKVAVDGNGNLVLTTVIGEVLQEAPVAYQETSAGRKLIASHYIMDKAGQVGFGLGEYDRGLPLVIDPVMKIGFSTFFGGRDDDNVRGVAVDSSGNAVIVGFTVSTDYPAQNEDPDDFAGGEDCIVTKFNSTGTGTIYSVYLGGRRLDIANAVAVDAAGNAYITGVTSSPDFPITPGVVDERGSFPSPSVTNFPEDCFVTKLDTTGNISYSTFLAGHDADEGNGIAVDSAGNTYVVGRTVSRFFPVKNAFQENVASPFAEAFLTVLNNRATGLIYSTFFGGANTDIGHGVALDSANNVYITGQTKSEQEFPVKSPSASGPFQSTNAGDDDVFVAKFNPFVAGEASLIYSTLIGGGGGDDGLAIAVDNLNRAHVTGVTGSFEFPLAAAPGAEILDRENVVNEAFVLAVNPEGSALIFSTFFGGDKIDTGRGIRVDAARNIYLAGNTTSERNFPVARAFQPEFGGNEMSDAFVAKLSAEGRAILYSSYLGDKESDVALAIDIDTNGNAYVAGDAVSDGFPITAGVVQPTRAGSGDAFLTKIKEMNPDTIGTFRPSTGQFLMRNSNSSGPVDITLAFGTAADRPVEGDWDGDGDDTFGVFGGPRNGEPFAVGFFLGNSNLTAVTNFVFGFGQPGDLPVAGDWDGDGDDEVGVFNNGTFTLRSNNEQNGFSIITVPLGQAGDIPVAGDWDGDGDDTVGVWRPATAQFFLVLSNENPQNALVLAFGGLAGDQPLTGDWDGDGIDTIGIFGGPRNREPFAIGFFLGNSNSVAVANLIFGFGELGDIPIAGDWDGKP